MLKSLHIFLSQMLYMYTHLILWFTADFLFSFVEHLSHFHSKVNVCFPSGISIGTDRQCDKWRWINPFLNAFRDVSAPLVTHTRDLCKSPSLLLWETHLQTLRQTLEWADNWTNTVGGCRGKRKRGTAVRQMWGLDSCQAAPRHATANASSQYEGEKERERIGRRGREMWKTAGCRRRKRRTWIDFAQSLRNYSSMWEHLPKLSFIPQLHTHRSISGASWC